MNSSLPNLKLLKKSPSIDLDARKYRELMPERIPPPSLIFWKCRFCAYQNAYIATDPELHFCKICETYQENVKEKAAPVEEMKDVDFDEPEEFMQSSMKCPQCGFTFHPDFNEECQCGMNLSQLTELLEVSEEDAEAEVEKLGLQILEVDGVKGGAIRARIWYPTAKRIKFMGDFNKWGSEAGFNRKKYEMRKDKSGVFSLTLTGAPGESFIGKRFKYYVEKANGKFEWRNDPRSVALVGKKYVNDLVYDNSAFPWTDQNFKIPPLNSLVIYETHIATLNNNQPEMAFIKAIDKLDYLKKLGINAIELLPITQDAHDKLCWGYDVVSLFAVDHLYGTADDLKKFINEAHRRGICVIIDWVPNHICKKSIMHEGYFYPKEDIRYNTRYGPRPDVSKPEVLQYMLDSLRSWISDFHFDGIRVDSIESMRFITDTQDRIIEAWPFMQEVTAFVRKEFPNVILIGEDLQNDARINNIMGFDAQWDTWFFSVMLNAAKAVDDYSRNCYEIANTLRARFEATGFGRVIYGESHDTIPEDRQLRLIKAVNPDNPKPDIFAKRRSRLVGSICFVVMGVPMLMAGQELMETRGNEWPIPAPMPQFDELTDLSEEEKNSFKYFADLIRLRLNCDGLTRGLLGSNLAIIHINPSREVPVIALHRWEKGGPRDDVVVVMNFSNISFKKDGYWIHFPRSGDWKMRLFSEGPGYGFEQKPKGSKYQDKVTTVFDEKKDDGYVYAGKILLKKYSMVILSQD